MSRGQSDIPLESVYKSVSSVVLGKPGTPSSMVGCFPRHPKALLKVWN